MIMHALRGAGRRMPTVLSLLVLAGCCLCAVAPRLFSGTDPDRDDPSHRLQPPSIDHLFGTDQLGRDLYARVVRGAAPSMHAALIAIVVAVLGGLLIGLIAGYRGGRLDDIVMRCIDALLAVPALLLVLAVVAAVGFGTVRVALAIGVVGVASFARVSRARVQQLRAAGYVEAARGFGVRWPLVVVRHVLPGTLDLVLRLATLEFGSAVLAISSLGFLGIGIDPSSPEWGTLMASGRAYLTTAWWLTTLPGAVVSALVLAANHLAHQLPEWRAD